MREEIIEWMLGERPPSDEVLMRGHSDTCEAFFYESDHCLSYLLRKSDHYVTEFVENAAELNDIVHLASTELISKQEEEQTDDDEETQVYDAALRGDSYNMTGYKFWHGDITRLGEMLVYVHSGTSFVACFVGDQTTHIVTSHFFANWEQWSEWFRQQNRRLAMLCEN
jgi:hypothetical protein